MTDAGFCPHCGAKRSTWAQFCGTCGKPYDGQATTGSTPPTAVPVSPAPAPTARSGWSPTERLVAVLIAVGVIVGGFILTSGRAPGEGGGVAATPRTTPVPTARSTPAPTEAPGVVGAGQAGIGEVLFGTGFDSDAFAVTGATSRFKVTYPEISYQATLSRAPGADELTMTISRRSGSGETVAFTIPITMGNPTFNQLANSFDIATMVDNKAGQYVMRFVAGGEVVAEGEFELVR